MAPTSVSAYLIILGFATLRKLLGKDAIIGALVPESNKHRELAMEVPIMRAKNHINASEEFLRLIKGSPLVEKKASQANSMKRTPKCCYT